MSAPNDQRNSPTAPTQPSYSPYGMPPTTPRQRLSQSPVLGFLAGAILVGLIAAAVFYLGPGQTVVRETRATATTQASTPTAAATATPVERVIYQDSLTTSGSSTGWSKDPACAFQADGLHVIGLFICIAPPDTLTDGTVTVTLKQVSGAADHVGGIVFRRVSTGSYYVTQIDALGHWSLDKVVNGTHTSLVAQQSSPALRKGTGASNTVTAHMVGSHFTISANGTPLGSVDDTTFTSGLIGLAGDADSEMVFNDLTISAPRT